MKLGVGVMGAALLLGLGGCWDDALKRSGETTAAVTPDELNALAESLFLPVDGVVHYYNRGTQTAFHESCRPQQEKISCVMDVLGMMAQIDHTLSTDYEIGAEGSVLVSSSVIGRRDWSNESVKLYDAARKDATKTEWGAGAPLARFSQESERKIIQNDLAEITKSEDHSVANCSVVPVGPARGIDVCVAFDEAGREVTSVALPRIATRGSLQSMLQDKTAVSRAFNKGDAAFMNRYAVNSRRDDRPAYALRKD